MAGPAIVIFGAAVRPDGTPSTALRRRVEAAVACGRRFPDAIYVPTGGVGRHGPAEAVVMAGLLTALGVPRSAILEERTGTDTLSSVLAVARLLRGRRAPVYAATSAYHLPRCLLLLRLAGLPARACPAPGPAARGWRRRWYWRGREALALPVDAVLLLALRLGIGCKDAKARFISARLRGRTARPATQAGGVGRSRSVPSPLQTRKPRTTSVRGVPSLRGGRAQLRRRRRAAVRPSRPVVSTAIVIGSGALVVV